MKVLKAEYDGPDSDGDITVTLEVAMENSSEHEVEAVKSSCLFLDKSGIAVCGNHDNEDDLFIEPGETEELTIWSPYLKANDINGEISGVTAVIDATLYRCEFHKLGEHSVPNNPNDPVIIENGFDIGDMIKVLGTGIFMEPIDDDGETRIEVRVGIRNVSDVHFDKVLLKAELLDKKGSEVDESTDYQSAAAFSGRILNPSFWGLKPSRLKNCTIKLSLSVFQPIGSVALTTELKKAK
jgi:hypothetical protein